MFKDDLDEAIEVMKDFIVELALANDCPGCIFDDVVVETGERILIIRLPWYRTIISVYVEKGIFFNRTLMGESGVYLQDAHDLRTYLHKAMPSIKDYYERWKM